VALLLIADASCLIAIHKIVFLGAGHWTVMSNSYESVESLSYPKPTNYIKVCVSVVSSPSWLWGGAIAANDFGRFVRFYACRPMQYA